MTTDRDKLREARDMLATVTPETKAARYDVLTLHAVELGFPGILLALEALAALANTPKQSAEVPAQAERMPTCLDPSLEGNDFFQQSAGLVEELRRYPDWLSTLNNIVRGLEDEGDRVYLGSTNDADDLREVARTLDDLSHKSALEGDRP